MNKKLDCTLIIPSHNRHSYLERIFEYYKDANFNVVCCDSSLNKYEKHLPKNVTYYHFPGLNFKQKMYQTIKEVKTSYIACCADDDFILKDSMSKGVDLLDKDRSSIALVGKYIGFNKKFNDKFNCMYDNNKFYKFKLNNHKLNVKSYMNNYFIILWGLYRRDDLLHGYRLVNKCNFKNDNFIEFILGTFFSYSGQIEMSDFIWGVREVTEDEHWGSRHVSLCLDTNISNDVESVKNVLDENFKDYIFQIAWNAYVDFCKKSYSKKCILSKIMNKLYFYLCKKNINRNSLKELANLLKRVENI